MSVQWKRAKHLIIDEVSMVDGNYFKKLEGVARVSHHDKQQVEDIVLKNSDLLIL